MQLKLGFDESFDIRRAYFVLFLLLLPTCFFLNNVKFWDDQYVLDSNAHWSLQSLFGRYGINSATYWRPVAVLSIVIPYLIGLPFWACKLISVVLYFFQGCVAIAVANQIIGQRESINKSISLISLAVLLALHPVFVETTLWMSARADLLMGLFVLIGIFWIYDLRLQEQKSMQPRSRWLGFFGGFFLAWLVCGSKDSGMIWPALAVLFLLNFSVKSRPMWAVFWRFCSAGVTVGILSYLLTRIHLLGSMTQLQDIGLREQTSIANRAGLFCEFIVRSTVNIFLPLLDQAPFKTAGWFDNVSPKILALILVLSVALFTISIRWIFEKNKTSGWLTLCSAAAIFFYAAIESVIEASLGNIVATRYLAPSALVIYIALCVILTPQVFSKTATGALGLIKQLRAPVAIIFLATFVQAIYLWTDLRTEWSSEMALWENSWKLGSRGELVAGNYSGELRVAKRPSESRKIAQDWLDQHPEEKNDVKICRFYESALISNIMLGDELNARLVARDALHIGWCSPELAERISFVLMQDHCDLVRPMLEQTLELGSVPRELAIWHYKNVEEKKKILLLGVYAEASCGRDEYMMNLLKALSKIDERWAANGPLAQSLIKSARTNVKGHE